VLEHNAKANLRLYQEDMASSNSESDPAESSPGGVSWRRDLASYLTPISHGSAPFITTFMLIHLTAPVMANLGGTSLSSQVMLLGREYYQTSIGEKYLVLAPLIIHPMASTAKRLLAPSGQRRPLSSILSSTGYLLFLGFLPIHYLTHRIYPSLPSPPIYSIGPAELDYEFVKTGLQTWPWRSWTLYAGLIGCASLHAVEGMNIIQTTWLKKSLIRRDWMKAVAFLGAVPVLSGMWVISREYNWSLASSVERYVAAYSQSLIYRWL